MNKSYRITDPSQRPVRASCNKKIVHQDKSLPGVFRQVANFIASLAEHTANHNRMIPLEVRQHRWNQCEPCEHRNRQYNSCSKCGCLLSGQGLLGDKLAWEVSKCPVGKWLNWNDLPVNGEWIFRPEVWAAFRGRIAEEIERIRLEPLDEGRGQGIVMTGGGKYFPSAYCNIRLIRHHRCRLPIELWYLGSKNEMPHAWQHILKPYGVKCIDADQVRLKHPMRILNGWELKVFAASHSSFRQFISLDADCFPMRDPSFTLDDPRFLATGAVFQRDCSNFEFIKPEVMQMLGIVSHKAYDLESGAFLIDKRRWGRGLAMTRFLNNYSDLLYKVVHGDKTTFALGGMLTQSKYAVPHYAPGGDSWGLMQKWFDGSPLWQHRIHMKPILDRTQFVSPQDVDEKQARVFAKQIAWGPEVEIYLAHLKRALKGVD
jgi:hypothetical protein